jgi:hypothetical protein
MKRLLPLCLVIAITACNQPYTPSPILPTDTISAVTHAVLNMRPQGNWKTPAPDTISAATRAILKMRPEGNTEHNQWQYDIPMGGDTYSYAHSAILKANNRKAHLKLFNDPPANMVVLQLDGDKFNNDTARTMEMKVQFDENPAATYTCPVDAVFGYLKLPPEFIKKIKSGRKVTIAGEMQKIDSIQQKLIIGYKIMKRKGGYGRYGSWEEVQIPIYRTWYEVNSTPIITKWEFYCSGLSWNY